ncbi:hypothetical protein BFP70_11035 [Thioclava sp. SK-1]|uniref:DMT family transporter n=1 Tax=Thioclava sp. SK-1 TaxID=1889770 RepID=UPI00082560B5|nr:DMT family transporter [Thioclava sp. SK-1]OCX64562.1 hypothetical protein BFP70_11035 [Thioclava sp. SK-1]
MWIAVTICAGAIQTGRFVLQKKLAGSGLSAGGATFSRFVFGAPIAILAALLLLLGTGAQMPALPASFWGFAALGGFAQAAATMALVRLFLMRNFAVGVAFSKTEIVQVALFSFLILGESITALAAVGIAIGLVGVLVLSKPPQGGRVAGRAAVLGIVAGGLFGLSAICYRGATLQLEGLPALARALVTLGCVTTLQSFGMAAWLRLREPKELSRVFARWRMTIWVGVLGILGSAGWFFAFALQNAAYVRALGQIEMVFTLCASWLIFHEKLQRREGLGIALIIVSLMLVVIGG